MTESSPPPAEERDGTVRAAWTAAVLGALFTVVAFAVADAKTALSVATGAGIAVANLLFMRTMIRAFLPASDADSESEENGDDASEGEEAAPVTGAEAKSAGRRGGIAWAILGVLKLVVLFGGMFLLLTRGALAPIPLVVGYGVLPVGIALSGLFSSLSPKKKGSRRSR